MRVESYVALGILPHYFQPKCQGLDFAVENQPRVGRDALFHLERI